MRGRRHVGEVELGDLADGLENRAQLLLEPRDLLLGEIELGELGDVQHLSSRDCHPLNILPKQRAPFRGPAFFGSERKA